jgi:long-chain acyl-CoA synthetase
MSIFKGVKNIFGGKSNRQVEGDIFEKLKSECSNIGISRDLLKNAVLQHKERIFLIDSNNDATLTYHEFYKKVLLFASKLKKLNVNKGDHVVLFLDNSVEFIVAYFAIWHIGAVVVPLNFFLHEKEISFIVKDSCPKFVVAKEESKHIFEKVCSDICPVFTEKDVIVQNNCSQAEYQKIEKKLDCETKNIHPDDMCLLLYTSGTTGFPKGVMLSSKNVLCNTLQTCSRFNMIDNLQHERFLCVLPLFHVFAQNTCMWLPIITGSSIIVIRKIDRRLIKEGFKYIPTMFMGFPALYGLLCLMRDVPLDSVKIFVSGADMLPDKIRTSFALLYGRRICSGYGLTEASPVVAVNYHNHERNAQVVGEPLSGISYQIRDDKGNILPQGEIGTLWIKGDNVMLGYYGESKLTEKILVDRWLNTGDLVKSYENGMISITGRSKDLIIHKGFNIYPQEIENLLLLHPAVVKAAVVGYADQNVGQIPVAYVSTKEKVNNIENLLLDFCVENIARYKVPKKIICLDDLPMSSTGKINKKILAQEKW